MLESLLRAGVHDEHGIVVEVDVERPRMVTYASQPKVS